MCMGKIKFHILKNLHQYNKKNEKKVSKDIKKYEPNLTFVYELKGKIWQARTREKIKKILTGANQHLSLILGKASFKKLQRVFKQLSINGEVISKLTKKHIDSIMSNYINSAHALQLFYNQYKLAKGLEIDVLKASNFEKLQQIISQAIENNKNFYNKYKTAKYTSMLGAVKEFIFNQNKSSDDFYLLLRKLLKAVIEENNFFFNNIKLGKTIVEGYDIYNFDYSTTVLDWQRADIVCNNILWNKFCAGYSSSFMNYSPSQKLWFRSYFRYNESRIGNISTFIYNGKCNQNRKVNFNLIKIFLRHANFYAHTTKKEEFIDYILKFANQGFLFKFINSIEYFAAEHKPQIFLLKNREHIRHVFEFIKDRVNVFSIATYPAIKVGSFGDPIKLAKPFYIIAHYKIKYDSKLKEPYCDQLYFDFDNLASIAKVNKIALQFFCDFFNETKKYPFDKEGAMRKNHAQKLKEYEEKEKNQWLERQIENKYKIMQQLI